MKKTGKHLKHKYRIAIVVIVAVLVITGALSLILYNNAPAVSALLASISAGCITGIVFYVLTNMRDNESRDIAAESKYIECKYQLTRDTINLCKVLLDDNKNNASEQNILKAIKNNVKELANYMGFLPNDSPKVYELIGEYPPEYSECMMKAVEVVDFSNDITSREGKETLIKAVLHFCNETRNILFDPMVELMLGINEFEKSKI